MEVLFCNNYLLTQFHSTLLRFHSLTKLRRVDLFLFLFFPFFVGGGGRELWKKQETSEHWVVIKNGNWWLAVLRIGKNLMTCGGSHTHVCNCGSWTSTYNRFFLIYKPWFSKNQRTDFHMYIYTYISIAVVLIKSKNL
jgi:hypothetical protein